MKPPSLTSTTVGRGRPPTQGIAARRTRQRACGRSPGSSLGATPSMAPRETARLGLEAALRGGVGGERRHQRAVARAQPGDDLVRASSGGGQARSGFVGRRHRRRPIDQQDQAAAAPIDRPAPVTPEILTAPIRIAANGPSASASDSQWRTRRMRRAARFPAPAAPTQSERERDHHASPAQPQQIEGGDCRGAGNRRPTMAAAATVERARRASDDLCEAAQLPLTPPQPRSPPVPEQPQHDGVERLVGAHGEAGDGALAAVAAELAQQRLAMPLRVVGEKARGEMVRSRSSPVSASRRAAGHRAAAAPASSHRGQEIWTAIASRPVAPDELQRGACPRWVGVRKSETRATNPRLRPPRRERNSRTAAASDGLEVRCGARTASRSSAEDQQDAGLATPGWRPGRLGALRRHRHPVEVGETDVGEERRRSGTPDRAWAVAPSPSRRWRRPAHVDRQVLVLLVEPESARRSSRP